MTVIDAPALAGSRNRAQQVLVDLPEDLSATDVVLSARGVIAAAISFVDEVVAEVLVRRHAHGLRVIGATDDELIKYFRDRAAAHNVAARLHFDS